MLDETHSCMILLKRRFFFTKFHQNRSRNTEITGGNSFTPLTCSFTVTAPIFTKLTLDRQPIPKNFMKIHHKSLLADARSRRSVVNWRFPRRSISRSCVLPGDAVMFWRRAINISAELAASLFRNTKKTELPLSHSFIFFRFCFFYHCIHVCMLFMLCLIL